MSDDSRLDCSDMVGGVTEVSDMLTMDEISRFTVYRSHVMQTVHNLYRSQTVGIKRFPRVVDIIASAWKYQTPVQVCSQQVAEYLVTNKIVS